MSSVRRLVVAFLAAFAFSLASVAAAPQKQIHLRNETIITPEPARTTVSAQSVAAVAPGSGLYLVQFEEVPTPAQRAELVSLGVELLRYVPEDAFIAEFNNVGFNRVSTLPYVRWVGSYRADQKIHAALAASRARSTSPTGTIEVTVMLSPRARGVPLTVARRLMQSISQQSRLRQGTIWHGRVPLSQLNPLAESSAVLWIEPAPHFRLNDEVASDIVAGEAGPGVLYTQSLGYDGSGVKVGVADSGLNNGDAATMHPDLFGRTPAFFYYGALTDAADEHSHGTHVAGIIAGNGATGEMDDNGALWGLGVAPGASLVTQRIFDGAGNFEPPSSFEQLTREAKGAGADVGSNSWGDDTQGRYDASAAEFDELVRDADALQFGDQPYILEFSAGNAGPGGQTIGSPAVAKNVIATGACENNRFDLLIYDQGQEAMADFSSRGPCEDGRIKPDVTAPGTWISSALSQSAGTENAWAEISANYIYMGGTSQAGPHASGAAAVFVQYYRATHGGVTPSPALVKAALVNSATAMSDPLQTGPVPNNDEGWGRVDLTQLIGSDRGYDFLDQTVLLTNGGVFEKHIVVTDPGEPLKITLAWTDEPGFPGAIPALVNDLDLEVIGPDGTLYRGDQFDSGESVANPPAADHVNNVEAVHLAAPIPGEYVMRVRGVKVVQDARLDTASVDQDFALVISGSLPVLGQGFMAMDRGHYSAADTIKLLVVDLDAAASSSLSVTIASTTETAGETRILLPSATSGVFTGSIATATGAVLKDGKLQVHHADTITASYFDVSAGTNRVASALADFVPPVIAAVSVTNEFNNMVVHWTTDEPATSIVRYGTNAVLILADTNAGLTTTHAVAIDDTLPGRTYYFAVTSADEAGNVATNNNGGALFSFVAAAPSTVLLVDAYVPDSDSPTVPLSTYTNALDQTGVRYDVWNASALGSPTLSNLTHYAVVIWRVSDSFNTTSSLSSLSDSQLGVISNFVSRGGSFFMSSMETLTRLGGTATGLAFRQNVLHIAGFTTNPDPFTPCPTCDEDHGVPEAFGVKLDPLTDGFDATLNYSLYPVFDLGFLTIGPDVSDTFTADTNAVVMLREASSSRPVALRYPRTGVDSKGRVVFLSFPLDTVPETGIVPNTRGNLLRNLMSFLAPGANGLGSIALDSPLYTLPSLVTVELADSDLAGAGRASVTASSDTQTNGISVTVVETARAGLFRGTFVLVATNAPPGSGQLQARNGDAVHVKYFDASANSLVQALAVVDTVPPTISNQGVEPDYETATVSWDTSKETDALVQFGESALLSRTAYIGDFDTSHAVEVTGLVPDRLYYYQITSRDVAGNVAIDDNHGKLYTFSTLKPLAAPWSENFEGTVTNWTVQDADGSDLSWSLGVPANGRETAAHSPTHCWGSNLHGQNSEYAETFLISPAILLTGGNTATLRFWQSYSFNDTLDMIEGGELQIVTNINASPVSLATYSGDSASWEQATVDLTPYVGHVVYLVWYYFFLNLTPDAVAPPGWLIDDVTISITNVIPGTVTVTNNLMSASFALAGPLARNGQGFLNVYSNAPPGDYVVTFGAIPWFNTPPPQTNTLVSGGTLTFTGNYTFPDTNNNGISDLWEAYYNLHGVTRTTDSDGDGVTDLAEFIAGTNPTNATSKLALSAPATLANKTLRLDWPSTTNRFYRLVSSSNLLDWVPLGDWVRANGSTMSQLLAVPTNAAFYRLQVQP